MASPYTKDVKQYDFPTEPIPRLDVNDPNLNQIISNGQPVIITGSDLVSSAFHWDLEYLSSNLGSGLYNVYKSNTKKFKYYDDKKIGNVENFKPPTSRADLDILEFRELLKRRKSGEWIYLQQPLNDTVGKRIVHDFTNFNWPWVIEHQKRNSWGPLTSNLLLIGMEGVVTPVHYDEQENIFAQIQGHKRFLLFSPDQFDCLYPYPVYHPHDRQSQVDFDEPDLSRFPNLKNLRGYEGVVGPRELLYIPMYWWHQVESLCGQGETISINFWYKAAQTTKVVYPLTAGQKVAIMRNIEKMLAEALSDTSTMPSFMRSMVLGRYT